MRMLSTKDRDLPRRIASLAAALAVAVPFGLLAAADSASSYLLHPSELVASWAYDLTDDRRVVGAADYVFFGMVLSSEPAPPMLAEQADEGDAPWFPRTAYLVRAVSDIKGDLSTRTGTTGGGAANEYTVLQFGGVGPTGELEFFEGDAFLEVGVTYLLITRAVVTTPGDQQPCPLGPCLGQTGAVSSSACTVLCVFLFDHPPAVAMIAPGFDSARANNASDRAALATRYGAAYQNEILPSYE